MYSLFVLPLFVACFVDDRELRVNDPEGVVALTRAILVDPYRADHLLVFCCLYYVVVCHVVNGPEGAVQ